jgi:uncharacterized membrane protein YfcA
VTSGEVLLLAALIFAAATLYSSVGHGGGSGYLAAMALFGLAPEVMKPTALVLNVFVASIGTVQYCRAGFLSWRVLWPFVVGSVPLAFLGGALQLPGGLYEVLVGFVLLFAAGRLFWSAKSYGVPGAEPGVPLLPALLSGAVIGLLAGLTGTGGGIFLTPLLLLTGWAGARPAAGVSVAFILVNSLAGLGGNLASVRSLPDEIPLWVLAAVAGGLLGSELGRRRLANETLLRLLALVLVVAGLKLILA